MYGYTEDNLSITNSCHACMLLDAVCQECEDNKDAKLTNRAWEIVDEGNLQYTFTLSYNQAIPSGHDWVSSTTVSRTILDDDGNEIDHIMREEFKLPIVLLQDGGELDNIWTLDDYTQSRREVICQGCNLTTPKMFNQCQSCDAPLEHNVSASLLAKIERLVK